MEEKEVGGVAGFFLSAAVRVCFFLERGANAADFSPGETKELQMLKWLACRRLVFPEPQPGSQAS